MTNEQLTVEEREAALKVLNARIDFAKFGFQGTLVGAIISIVAILALACIDGLLDVALDPSVYITFMVSCATATIAYGFFSLWSLPELDADFLKGKVAFGRARAEQEQRQRESLEQRATIARPDRADLADPDSSQTLGKDTAAKLQEAASQSKGSQPIESRAATEPASGQP